MVQLTDFEYALFYDTKKVMKLGYCGVSLFVSSYILMFSALAARYGVSPYVSLATRTLVRGQPRSGLLCVLCKLL